MRGIAHLKLQGGYGWMYQAEDEPRLTMLEQTIRSGKNAGTRRTWMVDNAPCASHAAAIAALEGRPPPEEPPMKKVSLAQQIEEIDRELAQRGNVYPRLVATGKLRQSMAEYQVARLVAARASLAWLAEHEAAIKQRLAQ